MSSIQVIGGKKLRGEIKIQGSKNAALPILAASILNKGITKLNNCPKILDVLNMISTLERLGCKTLWEENTLIIDSSYPISSEVPEEYVRKMRSSILFLGSLIGRCREVKISYPGGCSIGKRPIDYHLDAFLHMNIEHINESEEVIRCQTTGVKSSEIHLLFPSVGTTQNIILAGVLSEGTTRIHNAAMEPEIEGLCDYLNLAGANIKGINTQTIEITGVSELHDVEYTLLSDRIVAGTYMTAIAVTGGDALLLSAPSKQLNAVLTVLRKTGCSIKINGEDIRISSGGRLEAIDLITTRPYPGFPTDMQSQLMSLLSVAKGKSTIVEKIFESRYQNAYELIKMGADITIDESENKAIIIGVDQLTGAKVRAHDLRGGAALVVAGLFAEGKTVIADAELIARGYENICKDFRQLGADIIEL